MRLLLVAFLITFSANGETFQSHDGTVLHYDVVGKGAKVVMLSGGPGFSPEYLRPVADKLGDKYAFVLLHQRGTGKSVLDKYDAETISLKNLVLDLEALRKELKVNQLTIVGHSFGGILTMMYAREYPKNVGAIAFVDAGGPTLASVPKFTANLDARFSEEDRAAIREWSGDKSKENHKRAVLEITKAKTAAYFADRSKAKALIDSLHEDSFSDRMFWSVVPQMMTLDLRTGLEKVAAPVVVIHGKQDPLESAEEVHKTFPGSKLVMLDGAGHFPWLEQPDAFYAELGSFLASVESCH